MVTVSGSLLIWTFGDHFDAGAFRLAGSDALLVDSHVCWSPLSTHTAYRLPALSTVSVVKWRGLRAPGIEWLWKVFAPSVEAATAKPLTAPGTMPPAPRYPTYS